MLIQNHSQLTIVFLGLSLFIGSCNPRQEEHQPKLPKARFFGACKLDKNTGEAKYDKYEASEEGEKVITILGSFRTTKEKNRFCSGLKPFLVENKNNVKNIFYEGTEDFITLLAVRAESDKAPDIVIFPQPGFMEYFAREGKLVPLDQVLEQESSNNLQKNFSEWLNNISSLNEQKYGVWYGGFLKSLVWYNPSELFKVVENSNEEDRELLTKLKKKLLSKNNNSSENWNKSLTWDEVKKLSKLLYEEGYTPWCIGLEDGEATGWVGTDWIESFMLSSSPEKYSNWVNHDSSWADSEEVKKAFDKFSEIVHKEEGRYLLGSTSRIISTPVHESPLGLFSEPPECYMHRQGTFITQFFPKDNKSDDENKYKKYDFFLFPLRENKTILISGDFFTVFKKKNGEVKEVVKALINHLATSSAPHKLWVKEGGFISFNQEITKDDYQDEITKKQAEIFLEPYIHLCFDGSDMMPGLIGTNIFWKGMVDYIKRSSGETKEKRDKIREEILKDIDQHWSDYRSLYSQKSQDNREVCFKRERVKSSENHQDR